MTYVRVGCLSMVLLTLLVIAGLVVMAISLYATHDFISQRTHCVTGEEQFVSPGPGDLDGFLDGKTLFDVTQRRIRWRLSFGNLDPVIGLELFGPVLPATPYEGPLFLALCGPPSLVSCTVTGPNELSQTITESSPALQPLDDFIIAIRQDASLFRLRIKTTGFPNGALVAPLNSLC